MSEAEFRSRLAFIAHQFTSLSFYLLDEKIKFLTDREADYLLWVIDQFDGFVDAYEKGDY